MRIAQVVLTKTKSGQWKVLIQSLRQVENVDVVRSQEKAVGLIDHLMTGHEWEQLTDD